MSPVCQRLGPVSVYAGEKSGKYPDGNQVVVSGREMSVAFDMPLVANTLDGVFDGVNAVILGHVHEDHLAGLDQLAHLPLWVHEGDLLAAQSWSGMVRHFGYSAQVLAEWHERMVRDFHYKPRPEAQGYGHGQVWELGGGVRVRAHHLPGHTSGHCALVVEPEGVAFIGDIDLTGFGPYYGDATSSLRQFRSSLRSVRELDARAWVTSHHRGVLTDRSAFETALQAFADKLDQRAEKLLGMLQGEPQSLEALVAARLVYPVGYEAAFVNDVERRMIEQHLEELIDAGLVQCVSGAPDRFARV
jgi:glyoxylase-like metal-dependent hydrolase (beta-lactamase superfamily II)